MSKAEDGLFSLLLNRHAALVRSGAEDALGEALLWAEHLLSEHRDRGVRGGSELSTLVPSIGRIWLPLHLLVALDSLEGGGVALRARRYVPPSFGEIRRLFNGATISAAAKGLRLLTLDADETLYDDGGTLAFDAPVIPGLIRILRAGIAVAVVTAASYPGAHERFEARLRGLLSAACFAIDAGAPVTLLDQFYVMGGQCNYLYRAHIGGGGVGGGGAVATLVEVPGIEWKAHRGERWESNAVTATLDVAEESLRATASRLALDVLVIRKERAVGVVPRGGDAARTLSYEVLEEMALAAQDALTSRGPRGVPTCAFNGGHDVFVDIGTKALGIRALAGITGATPETSLHVGDRFTRSGNDFRARDVASTLWVDGPAETAALLGVLAPAVSMAAAVRAAEIAAEALANARDAAAAIDARKLRNTVHLPGTPSEVVVVQPKVGLVVGSGKWVARAASPQSSLAASATATLGSLNTLPPSSFRKTLDSRLSDLGGGGGGGGGASAMPPSSLNATPSMSRSLMISSNNNNIHIPPPASPRSTGTPSSPAAHGGIAADARFRVDSAASFNAAASRSAWLAGLTNNSGSLD